MTVIRVGDRVEPTGTADLFDGREARARLADIRINDIDKVLVIQPKGAGHTVWPIGTIRLIRDTAARGEMIITSGDYPLQRLVVTRGEMIITSGDYPLQRLVVTDDGTAAMIESRATAMHKGQPVRGRGRVLSWALAAIASVALIVFVLVPFMADRLATLLPPEGERALGEATLGQIQALLGDEFIEECDAPEGLDALHRLEDRLNGGTGLGLPYDLTITVLDDPMVNAFALPGGQVVLFDGILDIAESPDEIAAVLAHEIGHVAARDPTRIALRSAGSVGVLGLLLGDFAGGAVVLFLVEQLIAADYTREAETAADLFAIETMQRTGIDPSALGTLFARMRELGGDVEGTLAHFASHPALGERIARAQSADVVGPVSPALDADDWDALRTICDFAVLP